MCKTLGPLLHFGGGSLRKAEVKFLADPAEWAFRVEVKLTFRENEELTILHTLRSESNLVHGLSPAER